MSKLIQSYTANACGLICATYTAVKTFQSHGPANPVRFGISWSNCFRPFTFNLPVFLYLRCVLCRSSKARFCSVRHALDKRFFDCSVNKSGLVISVFDFVLRFLFVYILYDILEFLSKILFHSFHFFPVLPSLPPFFCFFSLLLVFFAT